MRGAAQSERLRKSRPRVPVSVGFERAVFDATTENAARRFIAMVDEFYDRRVNLVISASAAPTELYRGEKLAFEFERTAVD